MTRARSKKQSSPVPELRITAANTASIDPKGRYILYWMIAARRTRSNFAVDRAIEHARSLDRPLLVFEPLRAGYKWASDRHHTFVMQGMDDNAKAFAKAGITYLSYVEPEPGAGKGLLEALATHACVVVTDEQPGFFLPHMVAAAANKLSVRVEMVDGNGLLPLRASDRAYPSAASFRRFLAKHLPEHLAFPRAQLASTSSLRDADLPRGIASRWPSAQSLSDIPIDHEVAPVSYAGGQRAALAALDDFTENKLDRYADERSHPDADVASGLSPYLHFGHISSHEIVKRVADESDWDPTHLGRPKVSAADSFLDELITWRELGYGFCHHRDDYGTYDSLPTWARRSLEAHAGDPRPERYTHAQLERADTADPIWNAAQRELLTEGRIQNYLRMLWGKKILEWSTSPRAALETLVELNNKYAVDGRDPNSYSGILWTLGLFDRPWPERPIFGVIRYMTSASARRKLDLTNYLERFDAVS